MKTIDRLSSYLQHKGVSYNAFDKSIGAANGYIGKQVRSSGSIGSDIIEKISAKYTDLSLSWLLTGEGSMLIPDKEIPPEERGSPGAGGPGCPLCREKEKVITAQQRTIDILERELYYQKSINDELASRPDSGQKRKAG